MIDRFSTIETPLSDQNWLSNPFIRQQSKQRYIPLKGDLAAVIR
jgi:hypothetical protein